MMHDEHDHHHGYDHDHGHTHDHEHDHGHMHGTEHTGDMARELALLKYMLEHNRQHSDELAAAGDKLRGAGAARAAGLVADAVHYFAHGNEKLGEAVALLGKEG